MRADSNRDSWAGKRGVLERKPGASHLEVGRRRRLHVALRAEAHGLGKAFLRLGVGVARRLRPLCTAAFRNTAK